jgi:hypothetical protein
MRTASIARWLGTLAVACAANTAWGGPPFVTDDPETVDFRHWEVNYAIAKTWRPGESSTGLPSVDINYGAAPDLQLHLQPRYSVERAGSASQRGVDDTEVGVKYRILNVVREDSTWMLGIYPMLQLPSGDTSLGPDRGKQQIFLPLWAQWQRGNWTVYGGAGYHSNRGEGSRDWIYTGSAVLYRFSKVLQLGSEVFHRTADTADGAGVAGFNLGGVYGLADGYHVLFSAGRGLTAQPGRNEASIYLALQVLY